MTVEEQVVEMQRAMAALQRTWNEKVQPTLAKTGQLPAKFVIDMANLIVDGVISPVEDLRNEISTAGKIAQGAGLVQSFTGGGGISTQLALQLAATVKARAEAAASTVDFIYTRILTPLANEAKIALAKDGDRAMLGVVTTGSDRLDQVAITSLAAGITAIRELQQVQDLARSSFLFRLGELGVDCAKGLVSAVSALGTAIATVGAAFYGLFRTLILVAKVAVVGVGAYAGMKLYQQYRTTRAPLPAATSNPARRRRRARPRAYLR